MSEVVESEVVVTEDGSGVGLAPRLWTVGSMDPTLRSHVSAARMQIKASKWSRLTLKRSRFTKFVRSSSWSAGLSGRLKDGQRACRRAVEGGLSGVEVSSCGRGRNQGHGEPGRD